MFHGRAAAAGSVALLVGLCSLASAEPSKVTFDENGVLEINGRKEFVISFSIPPPPGGKTPDGKDAWQELKDAGTNFCRIAPRKDEPQGSPAAISRIEGCLDAAAQHGMHCWITMQELPSIKAGETTKSQLLRAMINRFKNHPGLGAWKGYDEPAWVKMPHEPLVSAYNIFKELDQNHPVVIIQAPTKASRPLEPYATAGDIFGIDIYPIAYPPGKHSDFGNPELSIVSDCTKWVRSSYPDKPIWMTLQVAWGGVASAGKRLRFPSNHQQRYMAYAAIINGARGLNWQGPALPSTLNAVDAKLEWNWNYWRKVQKYIVEELGAKSPVNPALIAPDSKMPVAVEGAPEVEFCVRETSNHIYVLAARREGTTSKVKFTGLAVPDGHAEVLCEEPQKVEVKSGVFEDWFAPNDVHVYRFNKPGF